MNLVWFKKDLRLQDHPALCAAIENSLERDRSLLLLYVYEESIIAGEDFSRRHLCFINDCLEELARDLQRLGQRLLIARGSLFDVLASLHEIECIGQIWSHQETGNNLTFQRDRQLARWCRERGISWTEFPQNGVIRRLQSRDGWARQWARRMSADSLPRPEHWPQPVNSFPDRMHAGIQAPETFGKHSDGETQLQRGGSSQAYVLLESFLHFRGQQYTKAMSSPVTAFDACSRISPYLTYGAISVREAYQIGLERQHDLKQAQIDKTLPAQDVKSWKSALRSFLGRLRWHCHFMQKLEDEPELEWQNLYRACDGLREQDWNPDYYQAWAQGRTGYPMVDASMRALRATGWINFRMRAMLMSFASYHLWLHWRETGLLLARLFTDYEPGIHWSQVQMQSGTTGINSIRIYSPAKQVTDQDPQGKFIRRWVPELLSIPDKYLPEPHRTPEMEQLMYQCRIGKDYPEPIVDHQTAYKSAQAKIRATRKGQATQQERQKIYQKHGSRKR